jgi:glycerol-3-phosphate dehydrogenase
MPDVSTHDGAAWRAAAFDRLSTERFDVLVIGGGINGAGIARDAAMRGLRTAIVEQNDFASGTSSRSSKLIHGGLRYLEQGHVGLVLEATRERERLRRLAPHLVRPLRFVYPLYAGASPAYWKLAAGLWAYDILAGIRSVKRHRMLRPAAVREAEPGLRTEGLTGAGEYWDCWTDDARLVLETLLSASEAGTVAVSYAKVTGLVKAGGHVVGAQVVDRLGTREVTIRARTVVNAAGPWVDAVTALDEPGAAPLLRPTKGVHVVVPRARIGNNAAIVLNAVQDRRVMFVIPWGEQSLVGTTDTDHEGGPDAPPVVEASDVAYLLDTVNHYFPKADLTAKDVVSAFAGLRPLVAPPPGREADPSDVSREEEIFASRSGLVSIAGGKLTTYRLVAAQVVDRIAAALIRTSDGEPIGPSRTASRALAGGSTPPEVHAANAISRDGHGLTSPVIGHLAGRYGGKLAEVLGLVARDRALGDPVLPALPDPRAEVVSAVEREFAVTLEDVLRRRTQIALFDPTAGADVAGQVATLMADALGWSPEAARAAADAYVEAVREDQRRWR